MPFWLIVVGLLVGPISKIFFVESPILVVVVDPVFVLIRLWSEVISVSLLEIFDVLLEILEALEAISVSLLEIFDALLEILEALEAISVSLLVIFEVFEAISVSLLVIFEVFEAISASLLVILLWIVSIFIPFSISPNLAANLSE